MSVTSTDVFHLSTHHTTVKNIVSSLNDVDRKASMAPSFPSLPTCSITNSAFSCWEWAFFGSHRILRVRQMYLCVTSASLACWKKCAHWDRTNWKPVTFHILVVQTLKLYVKNSIVSTKLYICIAIFSYYLLSRKHFGRMLLVQTLI